MKRIYNYILTAAALVAFLPGLSAQGPNGNPHAGIDPTTGNPRGYQVNDLGIGYSKDITGPDKDGNYTIHLHTFVEGNGSSSKNNLPADVVLVLDVSGSMNGSYSTYSYTARASQAYTYSNYPNNANSRYYYLHSDGNYYQVERQQYDRGRWSNPRYYYRLRFQIGGSWYYLNQTGDPTAGNPSTNITSNNDTIWEGVLYTRTTTSSTTKIAALRDAVNTFIDLITTNDEGANGQSLGNAISIVKFAGDRYCDEDGDRVSDEVGESTYAETGNHRYSNNAYNYTEVVAGFTPVADGGDATLKALVGTLSEGGATSADYGMTKAKLLINSLYNGTTPKRQSNKTVVFFTDGDPNHGNGFDETVANSTINLAKDIKSLVAYTDEKGNPVNVSVYSISIFDTPNSNRTTYMNRVSSNHPDATSMTSTTSGRDGGKYYQDASSGGLEDIFRSIASEAGGNSNLDNTTITAVDVVSQSFNVPDGAGSITFYEAPVKSVASNGTLTFEPKENWTPNPDGVSVLPAEDDPHKITATGFDYAKNYCGNLTIKEDGQIIDVVPHGSKLVIEIKIQMAGTAVGGPGVETNGPGSGIYLDGENQLEFSSPTVDLPVNLQVKKSGLKKGESAKFMIQRIPKDSNPSTAAENDWENVSTIFVTSTATGTEPDVFVRGLNPGYHYRILEENWDWSYNFVQAEGIGYVPDPNNPDKKVMGTVIVTDKTKVTSDKFITNPIKFTDKKKDNIESNVHHAESKAVNTFNGSDPVYVDSKDREKTTTPTNE